MDTPQQPNDALEPPPPPRKKKERSGCLMAVLIAVGVLLLGMGACGIFCYTNPEMRAFFGAMGQMVNAPGRAELEAAGCMRAIVMDMRGVAKLATKSDEVTEEEHAEMMASEPTVFVMCAVPNQDAAPDCNRLATVYVEAVSDPPPLFVVVVSTGGKETPPVCGGTYNNVGTYVGPPPEEVEMSVTTEEEGE